MSFATITQTGTVTEIQDLNTHLLLSLVIEDGKKPLLVEVYGKAKDIAKDLQGKSVLVTGNLFAVKGTLNINASNILEFAPKTLVSCVTICGRLGRKPENKVTATSNLCKTSVAVNTYQKETSWFNVTAWRKQAETMANYLDKGSMVGMTGRLTLSDYTKKDGTKADSHDIQVTGLYLMSKSMSEGNGGQAVANSVPAATQAQSFEEIPF